MSLTDTQLLLLSSASKRGDHLVTLPSNLKGGAAKKVVERLLSLALAKEIPVAGDRPAWRTEDNERAIGLKITRAGLKALSIEAGTGDKPDAPEARPKKRSPKAAGNRATRAASAPDQAPRPAAKQALIISLLSRAKGASLDALVEATGWLPHTTRAALTGLRKKGHQLAKTKNADGQTVYRIERLSMRRRAKDSA
jgi:hypothetical protein